MQYKPLVRYGAVLLGIVILLCSLVLPSGAQANGLDWQMVGQIGGTTKALLLEGDTLYLASGLHVLALDVHDADTVGLIGTSPLLPQFVESLATDGQGRLFACCGSAGLIILDVQNPASMSMVGRLDTLGYTEAVAIDGSYALLADGPQGLQIVDISKPEAPMAVASAYPLAYAYDVALGDGVAYLAGGGSGVFAIDLRDMLAPLEAGLITLNGFQYDVEVAGDSLYSAGAWGGVSVLSLATPLSPALVDTIATDGWAMALSQTNGELWVMDGANGVLLYSISGDLPQRSLAYTRCGFVMAGVANSDSVFLLDKEIGLMILDRSDPKELRLASRWTPVLDGRRLTMQGSVVYVAGGLSGMHVIDASNPEAAVETAWYDTEGGYANKVLLEDGKAYLSTHLATDYPLAIFDISNPLAPKRIGVVPNDEAVFNTAFRSIAKSGDYIYIPGEFADASVNVSNPTMPKLANRIDMLNPVNVAVSGQLMATVNSSELQLVDISDPENLRLITTFTKPTDGEAIAFIDDSTLIAAGSPGLWLVDVSNPEQPRKLAELSVSGTVMDITLDGTLAYLSMLGNGIQIVDIASPEKPVLLGGFPTLGMAYDCCVSGNLLFVADSFAGVSIYRRGKATIPTVAEPTAIAAKRATLPIISAEKSVDSSNSPDASSFEAATGEKSAVCVVTSSADNGPGTLRDFLNNLKANTNITFDPTVFPASQPAAIRLESPLPEIMVDSVTIDASNAGVVLDGSMLSEGNGLTIFSAHNTIMGLQFLNFPGNGLDVQGSDNHIGGSRDIGSAPTGQGNLCSGNGLYGIHAGGNGHVILGNLIGTDVTGTQPMPNYDGLFVSEYGAYITIGGTGGGEGNLISGNQFINMDTWGDHTRVINNIFGLDITGTVKVGNGWANNIVMESNSINSTVGGTTAQERNIISGGLAGVIFSDPNSYQNSVIGNYIGTDITGTKAIPNETGVLMWTSGNHRVGGTAAGEGNLISGNRTGITLNGYGVTDNIVLGNRIGVDAGGAQTLPNDCGIGINMGQHHGVIGGYTAAEGNLIAGGSIPVRISNPGIRDFYIASNTILNGSVVGLYLEDRASNLFVQGNTFGAMEGYPLRVDYGTGNVLLANRFQTDPKEAILLLENANLNLPAPAVKSAKKVDVKGTACAFGLVEIYSLDQDNRISPLGTAHADAKGKFSFQSVQSLKGQRIVLLATDVYGNTSAFSKVYKVK